MKCPSRFIDEPRIDTELTEQEKAVILKIAMRNGCDIDGDTLSFFVKEDENVVKVINYVKIK